MQARHMTREELLREAELQGPQSVGYWLMFEIEKLEERVLELEAELNEALMGEGS